MCVSDIPPSYSSTAKHVYDLSPLYNNMVRTTHVCAIFLRHTIAQHNILLRSAQALGFQRSRSHSFVPTRTPAVRAYNLEELVFLQRPNLLFNRTLLSLTRIRVWSSGVLVICRISLSYALNLPMLTSNVFLLVKSKPQRCPGWLRPTVCLWAYQAWLPYTLNICDIYAASSAFLK